MSKAADTRKRCPWCGTDALYVAYHDEEWGVPNTDDIALFEKLVLEGFQAGLSWITILRKRECFRQAFDGFDPQIVARYDARKVKKLLSDAGIVRHRGKIEAAISNAKAYLDLRETTSLAAFVWNFVDGAPIQNRPRASGDIPTETEQSRAMAKALKARGFRFFGPTTAYAFMQSVGMVNDHFVTCHRHNTCAALARTFQAPTA